MPKRVGFLYQQMADKDLIRRAIIKGAKGKHKRWDVKGVVANIDKYVDKTYELIISRSFIPHQPKTKRIFEPCSMKYRDISMVPFYPDGIIHQIMVMVMQPVIMKNMHPFSCASIPGRGTGLAKKKAERIIKGDPKGSKYGAELDIKSYYPSVKIPLLMKALERKIKDREFLLLVAVAITCYPGGMQAALDNPLGMSGVADGAQGLCIGFYLSQWLANFFLESLDWFAVKQSGVKHYVRHMDNISLFGPNKKQLHRARQAISNFMEEKLGVHMKNTWQIFPISKRMFSIAGYRIGREATILRRRNFLRLARQCRRAAKKIRDGKKLSFKMAAGLLSRIGQLKYCSSEKVWAKYIAPIGTKLLKEVVRNESKKQRSAQQRLYAGSPA